jgi:hypothetical protein
VHFVRLECVVDEDSVGQRNDDGASIELLKTCGILLGNMVAVVHGVLTALIFTLHADTYAGCQRELFLLIVLQFSPSWP